MGIISDIYNQKEMISRLKGKYKLETLVEILTNNFSDILSSEILLQDSNKIYIRFDEAKLTLQTNSFDNYKLFDDCIKEWLGEDLLIAPYLLYDIYNISDNGCLLEF